VEQQRRALWLPDETLARADPKNWGFVVDLYQRIVDIIGNPALEHEIISPQACLERLALSLASEADKPSVVIDLTGWLGSVLATVFPGVPVVGDFKISRLHELKPSMKSYGYMFNMTRENAHELSQNLPMAHPLIVDDVGMSGRTVQKTMDVWGIDPSTATCAFLVCNVGRRFGRPGALQLLTELGSKVLWGYQVKTPADDVWHLNDLLIPAPGVLDIALDLQLALSQDTKMLLLEHHQAQICKLVVKREQIKTSQGVVQERSKRRGQQVVELHGRPNADYGTNPIPWAVPHFLGDISIDVVKGRRSEVAELLMTVSESMGTKQAAQEEFGRIAKEAIG